MSFDSFLYNIKLKISNASTLDELINSSFKSNNNKKGASYKHENGILRLHKYNTSKESSSLRD